MTADPLRMAPDQRLDAFQVIGLSARQSAFLALVALHSGYCLRRQYVSFAGITYGKNTRDFLDSIVSRHLALRFSIRADRGYIYHLDARPVYRLLGLSDSRHRRNVSSAHVARKVMLLDYILSNPDRCWLATADEKVRFFTERLQIPTKDLPQRRRRSDLLRSTSRPEFFPHALPIAVAEATGVVTFVCLLTLAVSDEFSSFLSQHAATFRQLRSWQVVAIAPARSRALEHCQFTFAEFLGAKAARIRERATELRAYFTTRRAIDHGQLATLSTNDIDRFRTFRSRFGTAEVDDLYRTWLTSGDVVLSPSDPVSTQFGAGTGTLITQYLDHDYSQFGSLPGVA